MAMVCLLLIYFKVAKQPDIRNVQPYQFKKGCLSSPGLYILFIGNYSRGTLGALVSYSNNWAAKAAHSNKIYF